MVRAGQSSMVFDFFMYSVKHSAGTKNYGAEESGLRLVEQLPKYQNYRLLFGNWFSTFSLLINLSFHGNIRDSNLQVE